MASKPQGHLMLLMYYTVRLDVLAHMKLFHLFRPIVSSNKLLRWRLRPVRGFACVRDVFKNVKRGGCVGGGSGLHDISVNFMYILGLNMLGLIQNVDHVGPLLQIFLVS